METIYILSDSNNHRLDKFLMSIGFIESFIHGELTGSIVIQKLKFMTGRDLQKNRYDEKSKNFQTCWKPSILLPRVSQHFQQAMMLAGLIMSFLGSHNP